VQFSVAELSRLGSFLIEALLNWAISIHAGIVVHEKYSKNEECTQVEYDFPKRAEKFPET